MCLRARLREALFPSPWQSCLEAADTWGWGFCVSTYLEVATLRVRICVCIVGLTCLWADGVLSFRCDALSVLHEFLCLYPLVARAPQWGVREGLRKHTAALISLIPEIAFSCVISKRTLQSLWGHWNKSHASLWLVIICMNVMKCNFPEGRSMWADSTLSQWDFFWFNSFLVSAVSLQSQTELNSHSLYLIGCYITP